MCTPLLPYPLALCNKPQQHLCHHSAYLLMSLSSSVVNSYEARACVSYHFILNRVTVHGIFSESGSGILFVKWLLHIEVPKSPANGKHSIKSLRYSLFLGVNIPQRSVGPTLLQFSIMPPKLISVLEPPERRKENTATMKCLFLWCPEWRRKNGGGERTLALPQELLLLMTHTIRT